MSAYAFIKTLIVVIIAAFMYIIYDYVVLESITMATADGITGPGTFSTMMAHIWNWVFIIALLLAVIGGIIESLKRSPYEV